MTTIPVSGRFDTLAAPDIRAGLEAEFETGTRTFVVDLSNVSFMDSAALAVLVSLMKRCRADGGDVTLIAPAADDARRILRLTRFDLVFDIHEPT